MEWYNILVLETKAYIREAGFEPIIGLFLEKSTRATLVMCLIERWWDTTHTFYITEKKMTVTPYNFYRLTSLSFEGAIISLDGVSGIQLGLNMLGRKYSIKIICYFDLVLDYMLHLLGTYLFATGGQTVSLRWQTMSCLSLLHSRHS